MISPLTSKNTNQLLIISQTRQNIKGGAIRVRKEFSSHKRIGDISQNPRKSLVAVIWSRTAGSLIQEIHVGHNARFFLGKIRNHIFYKLFPRCNKIIGLIRENNPVIIFIHG